MNDGRIIDEKTNRGVDNLWKTQKKSLTFNSVFEVYRKVSSKNQ